MSTRVLNKREKDGKQAGLGGGLGAAFQHDRGTREGGRQVEVEAADEQAGEDEATQVCSEGSSVVMVVLDCMHRRFTRRFVWATDRRSEEVEDGLEEPLPAGGHRDREADHNWQLAISVNDDPLAHVFPVKSTSLT